MIVQPSYKSLNPNIGIRVLKQILSNNSQNHIVLKITGDSMEPTFFDQDAIKVHIKFTFSELKIGDVVAHCRYRDRVIVHRIVKIYYFGGKKILFRTKGDNNRIKDKYILRKKHIIGIVEKNDS